MRRGAISPTEVVEAALEAIARANGPLRAFARVDEAGARRAARALERDPDLAALPLAGIPVGVKESEAVRGWRTTYGDPAALTRAAEVEDAPQVAILRAAGAIPVGATNLALYGASAETTNPLFGTSHNPWDLRRVPGGSSGGSAAAVAARLVPLATGSDGGGSLRIPAAACGVVGFKPSLGLMPGDDAMATGDELAVRGPIARTCAETELVVDVLRAGVGLPHRDDGTPSAHLDGLRVAWSATFGYARPDSRVVAACEAALGAMAAAGARITVIDGPLDEDPLDVYAVLMIGALERDVRRLRGVGSADDLPAVLRDWLGAARSLTADDLERARSGRRAVAEALAAVLRVHDVLVSPTTAELAPFHPHPDNEWVKFTHPINLYGGPALSLPVGSVVDAGCAVPVGLQIAGRLGDDVRLLALGTAVERVLGLDLQPPPWWESPRPRGDQA